MARPTNLTSEEIAAAFTVGGWQEEFPPVLTTKQAGKLLGISASTLALYTQDGVFDGATGLIGKRRKHRRYWRDRLIQIVFHEQREQKGQPERACKTRINQKQKTESASATKSRSADAASAASGSPNSGTTATTANAA